MTKSDAIIDAKPKKRTNATTKRALKSAQLAEYLKRTGRKARKGGIDPNDRGTDHDFEKVVKRMSPEEFEALRDGSED